MHKYLLLAGFFLKTIISFASSGSDTLFSESQMVLKTNTGDIYGTLTLPVHADNIPVALIIAGSGPTDRDGNNPFMKNNSLLQLAHQLAENNIASLRYDKRGIAESKQAALNEANLRFEDYVNDAKQWIELLKKDKRFSQVVVIGHSEGSLIGMTAAAGADKFISIAGAGRPADQILKEQLAAQPQSVKDMSFPIIDSLKNGKLVVNVNPMLNALFRPSVQPYLISWFQYDPQQEIGKLKMPVLILQGTNDLQVTVDDANRLSAANPNSKLVLIENMNHIFKRVNADRQENIKTYSNPQLPIDKELVAAIVAFVKSK